MTDEPVLLSFEGGIATLTLNRPDNLNAASELMMRSLAQRLEAVGQLPGLRCLILTGTGRAFCAGGDLAEFEAALKAGGTRLIDTLRVNQDIIQMVEDLPVPVIGAEGATLGDGHTRYGVVPAGGASVRLVERIGPLRAAQLFYTAALIDARTAAEWGLVNDVVPGEELMQRAGKLAGDICLASPEANRHIKALTGRIARDDRRAERIRAELDRFATHIRGGDLAEGLAAFRAKRRPRYVDRGSG